jgi:hypothetical protein
MSEDEYIAFKEGVPISETQRPFNFGFHLPEYAADCARFFEHQQFKKAKRAAKGGQQDLGGQEFLSAQSVLPFTTAAQAVVLAAQSNPLSSFCSPNQVIESTLIPPMAPSKMETVMEFN